MSSLALNELFFSDVFFSSQHKGELSIYITNASEITAFQLELKLPDGISCTGAELSERVAADHTVAVSQRQNRDWFIGCWSMSNQTFTFDKGRICTLQLTCNAGVESDKYEIRAQTSLFFPDGGKVTGTSSSDCFVDISTPDNVESPWMSAQSFGQAFRITHSATSLLLQCEVKKGKLSTVKQIETDHDGTFLLEPAFDLDGNRYYLRSLSGLYLSSISEKSNTLGDGSGNEVSFVMTETGKGVYGLCFNEDCYGGWMKLQANVSGTLVTAGDLDVSADWKLEAVDRPCPKDYIEHMLSTAKSNVGLTSSSSDINLRIALHEIRRSIGNRDIINDADSLINRLYRVVKAARKSYLEGDTSIAEVPWGAPESFPSGEYAVYVEDDQHKVHFLSSDGGILGLTEIPSAFTAPIKDLFYNPVTDRYAVRLSGEDLTEEGCYISFNQANGSLAYASRSGGEDLRVWNIIPLVEAIEKLMTVKGKCGANISWRYDARTSTLILNGSGRTTYYSEAEKTPWYLYRSQIQHVVLAGDIQQLGPWLFAGCSALSKLTVTAKVPAGVESTTFNEVPAGLQIYALNPTNYSRFLEGCETHYLATLQEDYTYTGKPVEPVAVCEFPTIVQTRSMGTDVGEYSTSVSFSVAIEGNKYIFTANCPYRIHPAGIIVTTREYSKTYGAANPNFHIIFEGFLGKDNEETVVQTRPTISCAADKKSPVGEYEITFSGGEIKKPNYIWDYRPSVLRVNEARLMVIADDTTRLQGEANPEFTFHCNGFVNDEDVSVFTSLPVLTTDADEYSAPGKYYITVSEGFAPNYSLKYYSGVLTVEPSAEVQPLRADEEKPMLYDLMGRPLGNSEGAKTSLHGIYIVGGKKVLYGQPGRLSNR